jgi:hypothetical protein
VISLGVGLTADGHGRDLVDPATPVFGFCGGAVLLRTEAVRRAGGVPARFFCYYEDTDTAWRLRLTGHTIVSVPDARVVHRHGASTRLGSRQFHLWNERNRLAMLIRCAPAPLAAREVARFAALTALLPLRQLRQLRQRTVSIGNVSKGHGSKGHGADGGHSSGDIRGSSGHGSGSGHGPGTHDSSGHVSIGNVSNGNVTNSPVSERQAGERQASEEGATGGPSDPPWNFRVGLRLQVLRELLATLGPLLRERRTVTRLANVPHSVVWRQARSTNSAS